MSDIKPVAWAVPNTSITERHKYMQVMLDISGAQYPHLLTPLYDEETVQQLQRENERLKLVEKSHYYEVDQLRAELAAYKHPR